MKVFFLVSVIFLWMSVKSQPPTIVPIDTTIESRVYWYKWLTDLNEMGVEQKKDSLIIKEEVMRIVKDSVYRKSIYPQKYSWPGALALMKGMELKKAFWHMINIYIADTTTRSMVIGTFVQYDSLIEMDKLLINTYYTYAFTDPEACRIIKNKPDIFRPDIMEKKLLITKEIIGSVLYYRKKRKGV